MISDYAALIVILGWFSVLSIIGYVFVLCPMQKLRDKKCTIIIKEHRWNGWPGAICLDCGAEDKREICVADGHLLDCTAPDCEPGKREFCTVCCGTGTIPCQLLECKNTGCIVEKDN